MVGMSVLAAAAPWIPGITGCRGGNERPITLNVILHGLFILNFTDVNIEMFTPFVEDHIYRAGNWEWKTLQHLKPGEVYELLGVRGLTSAPPVDPEFNIAPAPGTYTLRPEYSVFTVHLPFPEKISLIRHVSAAAPGYSCPASGNNVVLPITKLSLCQVLTYRAPDCGKLKLSNTDWRPYVNPITGVVNLHFWAEPPFRLGQQHACAAYASLSQMLAPLQFQLALSNTAPLDLDTGVYGLPPEQEQGLSEWINAGEGSYPTNCSTAMLGVSAKPPGGNK
jgi:hypothetical protein